MKKKQLLLLRAMWAHGDVLPFRLMPVKTSLKYLNQMEREGLIELGLNHSQRIGGWGWMITPYGKMKMDEAKL
jgi:hypothetical protein